MPEFALAVPFPDLVERVEPRDDLPPHVTVLVPSPDDAEAIAGALAAARPFDVTFARFRRFPGVLWLDPEPAEPFAAMTEALVDRFPDYPPYSGQFDSVIPHLTVAEGQLDETEARIAPLLPLRARVETVVLYEQVEGAHWREVETFRL